MLLFHNLTGILIYSSPRHPDELKEGTEEHQGWKDLYPNIGDNKVEFADVGLVVKNLCFICIKLISFLFILVVAMEDS